MNSTALITDGGFAPKSNAMPRYGFDASDERGLVLWGGLSSGRDAVVMPFKKSSANRPGGETSEDGRFSDLIERIALTADREAFTVIFAYYGPRVKAYLLRLGLDGAQAEELAQDVMVAVWRKAASFDRRQASATTWIYRIARNRRIDVFRRAKRAMLDAHDPAFQPSPETAPDSAAQTAQREDQVRRAINELPPEQRDLVRDAFYKDLSHGQIAEKTGIPLGTVKSRLRLAFAKLKLQLDDDQREGVVD
jgi:RNA polymerase sigma-70 factor (ECF subfamily)